MKVAGYIRVSDQKLKSDGERRQDINRQRDKITKFSETMGWGIPEFYSDDGISAFKEDYNSRPQFVKMLREIRGHKIQRVIVEDLTRWSRRIGDGLKTITEASEAGCTVTSMSEGNADVTYNDAWAKTAIMFLFAEWASRSASDKVISGMLRRKDNKDNICPSCKIVHLGRHPKICLCKECIKKGRSKVIRENVQNGGTAVG